MFFKQECFLRQDFTVLPRLGWAQVNPLQPSSQEAESESTVYRCHTSAVCELFTVHLEDFPLLLNAQVLSPNTKYIRPRVGGTNTNTFGN